MAEQQLPTIRIKYAWLLRQAASEPLSQLQGSSPLLSDEQCADRAREYAAVWKPYQTKVLAGITATLGLSFRQNIIDVYIAPCFKAFSDPLVIGTKYAPDEFIDILSHELLHRLLTDNMSIPHETKLLPEWRKLFGAGYSHTTLAHIPVHAVHQAIYLDILQEPKRLERDITRNKRLNAHDYIAAWEYVEEHGYKEVIAVLKESYGGLSSRN